MRSVVYLLLVAVVVSVISTAQAADEPATRVEVPDSAAVEKARTLIRDLFKKEYAQSNPRAQSDLAQKLLKQAAETKGDPAALFALLDEARNLAAKAGDLLTATKAIDQMTAAFQVGRGNLWAAIATPILASIKTPRGARDAAFMFLSSADAAADCGQWKSALTLARSAESAARRSREVSLLKSTRLRARRITRLYAAVEKVRKDMETLKAKPDDPAANLAVGQFLCLYRNDWDAGVKLLAKGADAKLQAAAKKDLAAVGGDALAKMSAADGWYDLAQAAQKDHKPAMQVRAHYWYQLAMPMLSSLQKVKAEKRVAELQPVVDVHGGSSMQWGAIRRAIADSKIKRWRIIGGAFSRQSFEELPKGGAILIGFKYTTIGGGRYPGVVQAIYQTSGGIAYGRIFGVPERGAKVQTVKAKPGYAVGAIHTRGGGGFDAFKPIFMRINGNGLDANDKYEGPHIGGMGGSPATLGGEGQFIIGLHGKVGKNGKMEAMSPVTLEVQTSAKSGNRPMLRPRRRIFQQ